MRVFIAGATGVLGRRLVPMLLSVGHEVVGTTRSKRKAMGLRQAGARAIVLDALNGAAVHSAIRAARPQVIVHELTALEGRTDIRKMEQGFELTNRLRTQGTDILISAAREAGVRRMVAQSFTGWPNERGGGTVKTEQDPLDRDPPAAMRATLDAIEYVEHSVTHTRGLEGLVLRYGTFYGPGTTLSEGGEHVEQIRRRRFPVVGDGEGVWSFVHIDDAASATIAAIERGRPGVYNVVDDEPARVSGWLPAIADTIGARPPRHVPVWLARLLTGEAGVSMMTSVRGSSNAKAKRELGWLPRYPSWRSGFRLGLGRVDERPPGTARAAGAA